MISQFNDMILLTPSCHNVKSGYHCTWLQIKSVWYLYFCCNLNPMHIQSWLGLWGICYTAWGEGVKLGIEYFYTEL